MSRLIVTERGFDADLQSGLQERGDRILDLDERDQFRGDAPSIDAAERQAHYDHALTLAQRWHLTTPEVTTYRDVSLGAVVENAVWQQLQELLIRWSLIERAVGRGGVTSIVVAGSSWTTQVVRAAAPGVPVQRAPAQWGARSRSPGRTEAMTRELKRAELDRHARLTALLGKSSPSNTGAVDVVTVLEQPGAYLADAVLPVLDHFDRAAVLVFDPRHASTPTGPSRQVVSAARLTARHLPNLPGHLVRFARKVRQLRLPKEIEALPIGALARTLFRRVIRRRLPVVALEVDAAYRFLEERKVRAMVLYSDAHHAGRLMTLVGARRSIPSVVVQHGATFNAFGYLPLYATRFAAWGETSKAWLQERGAPEDRVVVTGNPRHDRYAGASPRSGPGFHLLWAVGPAPDPENEALFADLRGALAAMEDLVLVVRLHPAMARPSWLPPASDRILHSPSSRDLCDALAEVDGVVTQGSTVGVDAACLGLPVIVHEIDAPAHPAPAVFDALAVASARGAAALVDALSAVREGRLDARRQEAAARYAHRIDGRSAERVAALARALM